jgi:hypothetical protein
MFRPLTVLTALALAVPSAAAAAPLRDGSPAAHASERLHGNGAWIGGLVFLLVTAGLLLAYSSGSDAGPASP